MSQDLNPADRLRSSDFPLLVETPSLESKGLDVGRK
uniref:Adaptor related protein complex 1 subunit sigma 1 n=1 Tax=Homo sapiens TaxID=9606 RepID=A0A2R8Y7S3_HUMAN